MGRSLMRMVTVAGSKATPARPAAASRRPQLGSALDQAVLQSGDVAMVRGDGFGVGVGAGSGDFERDDVGDTFAVVDDLVGERIADTLQRGLEGRDDFALGGDAARAAGEQQDGIVGGGVAVDGDAVEAGVDGGGEHGVEVVGAGGEVGEDVGEHGGVGGRRACRVTPRSGRSCRRPWRSRRSARPCRRLRWWPGRL